MSLVGSRQILSVADQPSAEVSLSRRVRIFGVPVDATTEQACLARVRRQIEAGQTMGHIVAINPEKVYAIRHSAELARFAEDAYLLIPDGIGVVQATRILHSVPTQRVAGADLMEAICRQAAECGHRIFVYGSSEEVNAGAVEELCRRYPGLQVAGRSNGYVDENGMDELVERINASGADILFLALGSPRQEQWIQRYRDVLQVKICMGIGGTLDTIVGKVQRAPRFWQRLGLEWLYRLIRQPSRWRRQTVCFRFAAAVLTERVLQVFGRSSPDVAPGVMNEDQEPKKPSRAA